LVVAVVNKKQGKSGISLRMYAELRQIPDKGMQQECNKNNSNSSIS